MEEAETPRKGFWAKKKFVLIALAVVLAGSFAAYVFARGLGPFAGVWRGARSLAAKTFRDVLGSGGAELVAEIDMTDSRTTPLIVEENSSSPGMDDSSTAAGTSESFLIAPGVPPEVKKVLGENPARAAVKNNSQSLPPQNNSEVSLPAPSSPSAVGTASSSPMSVDAPTICDFESAAEPKHLVLFNEIAWMGSIQKNGETGTQSGNREWMELRDNAGTHIDLSGWQILDSSGKLKIIFDAGAHIDFGGFFLLERGDDDSVPSVLADKIYSGTLSNAGDWLRLFDRSCELIDEINASSGWPGGDNITKATLERDLMDLDWHTSGFPGGTPKAQNSVVWKGPSSLPISPQPPSQATIPVGTSADQSSTPAFDSATSSTTATSTVAGDVTSSLPNPPLPPPLNAPTHLVIAAVQIAGAASSNDFLKIFNPTLIAVDIGGWKLRKRTSTGSEASLRVLPAGSLVQPQSYFTWANSANGFAASIGADASSSETLATDNSAALEDSSGIIIDAVAWGTGLANPFVEGTPYPDNPAANQTLARKFTAGIAQDTDDNSRDFSVQ